MFFRQPMRVLVIEDEDGMREWLTDSIKTAGFEVTAAANGRSVAGLLSTQDFDLCITDLAMPDAEGLETIQLIKRSCPSLKVIAISGAFGPEILKASKILGAKATLQKPIRLENLLETVREVIGQ